MYELVIKYGDYNFSGSFTTKEDLDSILDFLPKHTEYSIYRDNKLIKMGGLGKSKTIQ